MLNVACASHVLDNSFVHAGPWSPLPPYAFLTPRRLQFRDYE